VAWRTVVLLGSGDGTFQSRTALTPWVGAGEAIGTKPRTGKPRLRFFSRVGGKKSRIGDFSLDTKYGVC
jgi:hypothetical protein